MSRGCDAIGCVKPTVSGMFMCRFHWKAVPAALQRAINTRYRVCRADFAFLRDVAYLQAAVDAIAAVATAEGKTGTNPFARHLALAQRQQPPAGGTAA